MEHCMADKALKSSLRRELATKSSTQQVFLEELCCVTGLGGVPSEDFSVDDLLDLSNGEFEDGFVAEEEEEDDEKLSLSVEDENSNSNSNSSNFAASADSESPLATQLAVPDDDLAELEWVSHFVDDSVLELSLLHPVSKQKPVEYWSEPEATPMDYRSEPEAKPAELRPLSYRSQVPVKPRSKRSRLPGRVWSLLNPLGDSASSASSSSPASSSSSSGFSFSTPWLIFSNTVQNVGEPAAKKQKKKSAVRTGGEGSVGLQFQRRCTHCQVQKTPQWRTGPLGAKTLCNACGVRYKSGRLFPEYRPACSPTFSGDVHSNSHRKVLEMRRRKETGGPESGLTQMISSF